jgi:hypothetical protein
MSTITINALRLLAPALNGICSHCGATPCYHICPNSPHYYSAEQERADDATYGADDISERYAAEMAAEYEADEIGPGYPGWDPSWSQCWSCGGSDDTHAVDCEWLAERRAHRATCADSRVCGKSGFHVAHPIDQSMDIPF